MTMYFDTLEVGLPAYLGGQRTLTGLREVTVIIARNGHGNSTLLRNLHQQRRERYHYSSPERAGELTFDPSFAQTEFEVPNRGGSRLNKNAAASYRRESISRLSTVLTKMGVRASKDQEIPRLAQLTEDMLSQLLPNFAFRVTEARPPFITGYRLTADGGEEEIANLTDSLSRGETEALTVALDLLTVAAIWALEAEPGEARMLLVDEPDPHLHPDLQVRFARFLLRLARDLECQILL